MRFLMTQLAYFTRAYFLATYSGFGNAENIAGTLYSLPYDFKEKAELIFGTPLSEEFMTLLSMHVSYIQYLADALKTRNQAAADLGVQQLYRNANAIAAQYAKMNPFWNETYWRTLLNNYANLLIQDAVELSAGEYQKDMDIFERMLVAALLMGDYLTDGLHQYITATRREETI